MCRRKDDSASNKQPENHTVTEECRRHCANKETSVCVCMCARRSCVCLAGEGAARDDVLAAGSASTRRTPGQPAVNPSALAHRVSLTLEPGRCS